MLEKLNDLWSPDVKAHQLAEVISGVEPIRSFVNVGSGVADLVLLPIAQYQKDGRIMRGLQKGATSFVKTTALEALTIGARLANGTQIILEQAESFLGGGPSPSAQAELENSLLRWESVGIVGEGDDDDDGYEGEYGFAGEDIDMTMSIADLSRYAHQPTDVREGLRSAYKSLGKNLGEAAQTILAVPIEVYERSGTEVRKYNKQCLIRSCAQFMLLIGPREGGYTSFASGRSQTNDRSERGCE
jgi:autophagy-related protein 2